MLKQQILRYLFNSICSFYKLQTFINDNIQFDSQITTDFIRMHVKENIFNYNISLRYHTIQNLLKKQISKIRQIIGASGIIFINITELSDIDKSFTIYIFLNIYKNADEDIIKTLFKIHGITLPER